MIRKIDTDFNFKDARGELTQLVHTGYEQFNVLESNKGVIRGGHYHKVSTEAFFVIRGSVEVGYYMLKDAPSEGNDMPAGAENEKKVTFNQGDFFEVTPFTVHSMYFPEDCIMAQMYSICVEAPDGSKDIYQDGES